MTANSRKTLLLSSESLLRWCSGIFNIIVCPRSHRFAVLVFASFSFYRKDISIPATLNFVLRPSSVSSLSASASFLSLLLSQPRLQSWMQNAACLSFLDHRVSSLAYRSNCPLLSWRCHFRSRGGVACSSEEDISTVGFLFQVRSPTSPASPSSSQTKSVPSWWEMMWNPSVLASGTLPPAVAVVAVVEDVVVVMVVIVVEEEGEEDEKEEREEEVEGEEEVVVPELHAALRVWVSVLEKAGLPREEDGKKEERRRRRRKKKKAGKRIQPVKPMKRKAVLMERPSQMASSESMQMGKWERKEKGKKKEDQETFLGRISTLVIWQSNPKWPPSCRHSLPKNWR